MSGKTTPTFIEPPAGLAPALPPEAAPLADDAELDAAVLTGSVDALAAEALGETDPDTEAGAAAGDDAIELLGAAAPPPQAASVNDPAISSPVPSEEWQLTIVKRIRALSDTSAGLPTPRHSAEWITCGCACGSGPREFGQVRQ
ncbi:MAG: hypothetical protein JOZ39_12270 [Chloroflexi bacterium]|nr:hypothetical protein [Chloroflexota bacterium]